MVFVSLADDVVGWVGCNGVDSFSFSSGTCVVLLSFSSPSVESPCTRKRLNYVYKRKKERKRENIQCNMNVGMCEKEYVSGLQ